MKILVLTKCQYMGKDLLNDRFGRFRELPLGLAQLGHEVLGIACSYRRREEGVTLDSIPSRNGSVAWHSLNAVNRLTPRLGRFAVRALTLAGDFRPDLIWSCSDAYHAIFGAWLAKRIHTRCVIDLYDNFEAFRASKLPGILRLFKRAVREADGVTFFCSRLADYVVQTYPRRKPSTIVENGVPKDLFYPRDRDACRQRLGLPKNARIIGTAGALDTSRGIGTLFRAFERLAAEYDDLHLALAGPREHGLKIPQDPRIHDLKILPHEEVPSFIGALDVAVVCYRQSPQGEFSFPQKAYEIMACRVPFIAAAVGTMNELLHEYPACLYEPENPESLVASARRQLKDRVIIDGDIPSWADSAKRLENFFSGILGMDANRFATNSGVETAR
jgi:teichuronic acid biosynthesis glycosyltransferase TuaC